MIRALFVVTTALALGACATAPAPTPVDPPAQTPKPADGAPGSYRYEHKVDSGPEQRPDVDSQPEPVPKE